MRKTALVVIAGLFINFTTLGAHEGEHKEGKAPEVTAREQVISEETGEKVVYVCPMHPEIRVEKPGECPKCGMKLEMMSKMGEEKAMEENKEKAHGHASHNMHGMSGHKH